ncbi:MAG: hypothetical protein LBD81_03770, partial [Holosporaceae bacterium]|nr:hypothetical protein [Holosporaceae bacterium]
ISGNEVAEVFEAKRAGNEAAASEKLELVGANEGKVEGYVKELETLHASRNEKVAAVDPAAVVSAEDAQKEKEKLDAVIKEVETKRGQYDKKIQIIAKKKGVGDVDDIGATKLGSIEPADRTAKEAAVARLIADAKAKATELEKKKLQLIHEEFVTKELVPASNTLYELKKDDNPYKGILTVTEDPDNDPGKRRVKFGSDGDVVAGFELLEKIILAAAALRPLIADAKKNREDAQTGGAAHDTKGREINDAEARLLDATRADGTIQWLLVSCIYALFANTFGPLANFRQRFDAGGAYGYDFDTDNSKTIGRKFTEMISDAVNYFKNIDRFFVIGANLSTAKLHNAAGNDGEIAALINDVEKAALNGIIDNKLVEAYKKAVVLGWDAMFKAIKDLVTAGGVAVGDSSVGDAASCLFEVVDGMEVVADDVVLRAGQITLAHAVDIEKKLTAALDTIYTMRNGIERLDAAAAYFSKIGVTRENLWNNEVINKQKLVDEMLADVNKRKDILLNAIKAFDEEEARRIEAEETARRNAEEAAAEARRNAEAAEQQRRDEAERQRLEAEALEAQRLAAEQAAREAERQRLEAEALEARRLADEQAERQRREEEAARMGDVRHGGDGGEHAGVDPLNVTQAMLEAISGAAVARAATAVKYTSAHGAQFTQQETEASLRRIMAYYKTLLPRNGDHEVDAIIAALPENNNTKKLLRSLKILESDAGAGVPRDLGDSIDSVMRTFLFNVVDDIIADPNNPLNYNDAEYKTKVVYPLIALRYASSLLGIDFFPLREYNAHDRIVWESSNTISINGVLVNTALKKMFLDDNNITGDPAMDGDHYSVYELFQPYFSGIGADASTIFDKNAMVLLLNEDDD